MGGKAKAAIAETKVLSVRVPAREVEQIDADAKAAGMNRNDFVRMKVREKSTFAKAESVIQLIEALRQLTIMFDTYLSILERFERSLGANIGRDELAPLLAEIEQAKEMLKLTLKIQRQAVRVLRSMHDDVRR